MNYDWNRTRQPSQDPSGDARLFGYVPMEQGSPLHTTAARMPTTPPRTFQETGPHGPVTYSHGISGAVQIGNNQAANHSRPLPTTATRANPALSAFNAFNPDRSASIGLYGAAGLADQRAAMYARALSQGVV